MYCYSLASNTIFPIRKKCEVFKYLKILKPWCNAASETLVNSTLITVKQLYSRMIFYHIDALCFLYIQSSSMLNAFVLVDYSVDQPYVNFASD